MIAVSFMITCHLFSWDLHFNWDLRLHLTTIIQISTRDLFLNNNILTQSIILLPIFSEHVLSRIKIYSQFRKTKQHFESLHKRLVLVTYFRNIDEDRKENFRMEVVKKGLVFAAIRYAILKFTYHWCFAHAQLKLWKRVLAPFCFYKIFVFQVVTVLVETHFVLHISIQNWNFPQVFSN